MKPNFFLIGAPKSGTTALAAYLAMHPNVCFSVPKELFYWNEDYPWLRDRLGIYSEHDYLKFFANWNPEQHSIVAEGSTTYLQSRVAVQKILEYNPDAKFVAILRNPVDTAYALHGELLVKFNEDEPDFEKAWSLQQDRSEGRSMPRRCGVPNQLQYRDVAAFGDQLSRFFAAVPESRRRVFLHEDLVSNCAKVYGDVLEFAGLPHDGRDTFSRFNEARRHRFGKLAVLYHAPPKFIKSPIRAFQKWLAAHPVLKERLRNIAYIKKKRPPLSPDFRVHLTEVFNDEIHHTADLLQRDLSHWLQANPSQQKATTDLPS